MMKALTIIVLLTSQVSRDDNLNIAHVVAEASKFSNPMAYYARQAARYADRAQLGDEWATIRLYENALTSLVLHDAEMRSELIKTVWQEPPASFFNSISLPKSGAIVPPSAQIYKEMILGSTTLLDEDYIRSELGRVDQQIVGGQDVPKEAFLDCVAVAGPRGQFIASGVVVAPRVVLTAAHVWEDANSGELFDAAGGIVFVGHDLGEEPVNRTGIVAHIRHHEYEGVVGPRKWLHDIAILILDAELDSVSTMASSADIDRAQTIHAVGFGRSMAGDATTFGRKREAGGIGIRSNSCQGLDHVEQRCHRGRELVAIDPDLRRDTCRGDSGGPIYIWKDDHLRLAGIASRATGWGSGSRCGYGGIYVRVDKYLKWIYETVRENDIAWPEHQPLPAPPQRETAQSKAERNG